MATRLDSIIKKSAKKNAHGMVATLIRQFIEREELDEEDLEDIWERDALEEIMRYHERRKSGDLNWRSALRAGLEIHGERNETVAG